MLIINISSYEEFNHYINKYKYVIVNISAVWCKPCTHIKPRIEQFFSVIDDLEYIYLRMDYSIYEEDREFENLFHLDKIPFFAFIRNKVVIDSFVSGDFNIVSKRLFDNIIKEREEYVTQFIMDDFMYIE